MQPPQVYQAAYPAAHGPPLPRYSSAQCTSSAFSASAQPNEDWTKISDLAERRRIQNRIAQRNYRKKLKRRLEDLEKQASTSPSPEQKYQDLAAPIKSNNKRTSGPRRQSIKREDHHNSSRKLDPEPLVTPYSSNMGGRPYGTATNCKREPSMSPIAPLDYAYPLPSTNVSSSYQPPMLCQTLPQPFSDYPHNPPYLSSGATTLPALSSFDGTQARPEHYLDEGNITTQYDLEYTPFTSMELPIQQQFPHSSLNTPPLSHSRSFDRSRDGSPSILPLTPISSSSSPKLAFR